MLKKTVINLYFGLFERGVLPDIYSKIFYTRTTEIVQNLFREDERESLKKDHVFWVKYVPSYLQPCLKEHLKRINFFEIKGYAIHLGRTSNINEYLKTQVKTNLRGTVRSNIRRLETCFDINYQMFYGEIDTREYDFLLDRLKKMIVRRFSQRNEVNKKLNEWNRFHSLFFKLINAQRASLFVIYEGKKPIAISLNYHVDKIFFNAIPSYDIDYGKFGLGHITIYKQLEWCIKSGMHIFDMGMGNPEYKTKWCNTEYDFEHHIVYRSSSILDAIYAKILAFWICTKKYLKSKNIHILYKKVKTMIYGKSMSGKKSDQILKRFIHRFESVIDSDSNAYQCLSKIDLDKQNYSFLKQYVYEFLHKTTENISDIAVCQIEKEKVYLIKGRTHSKKLFLVKVKV